MTAGPRGERDVPSVTSASALTSQGRWQRPNHLTSLRSDPGLLPAYLRSGVEHRVVGPLLSPWRPGSVAMFHIGSSGSTVLSDLLDQHPRIAWDGETYGRVVAAIKRAGLSRSEVSFDPVAYVAGRQRRSGRRWFGFDVKFAQITEFGMSLESYVRGLRRVGVTRFVGLRREHYLRRVISGINGGRRGRYHHRTGAPVPLPPFRLGLDDVVVDLERGSLLEHFERWDAQYSALGRLTGPDLVWVSYESDIANDPTAAFRLVIDHLGLAPSGPTVRLTRANPEPVSHMITNLDEVRDYLAGSHWAWMATED